MGNRQSGTNDPNANRMKPIRERDRYGVCTIKIQSNQPANPPIRRNQDHTHIVTPRGGIVHGSQCNPQLIQRALTAAPVPFLPPIEIPLNDSRAHKLLVIYANGWHAIPSPEVFSRHSGTCVVLGDRNNTSPPYKIKLGDCFRLGSVGVVVSEMRAFNGEEQRLDSNMLQYLKDEALALDSVDDVAALAADEGDDRGSLTERQRSNEGLREDFGGVGGGERFICYMCYETHDTPDDPLVAPCECRGDTRYLHVLCLQKWYQSSACGPQAQVIRTTGNGAPACKICGSAYKTAFRKPDGRKASLLEMESNGPYLSLVVVTRHDTNPGLFNTKFRLNFGRLRNGVQDPVQDMMEGSNELIVGRSSSCNMILDYRTVSTVHAKISYEDGNFYLQDRRSSNGTMVYLQEPMALPYASPIRLRMGRTTITVQAKRSITASIRGMFSRSSSQRNQRTSHMSPMDIQALLVSASPTAPDAPPAALTAPLLSSPGSVSMGLASPLRAVSTSAADDETGSLGLLEGAPGGPRAFSVDGLAFMRNSDLNSLSEEAERIMEDAIVATAVVKRDAQGEEEVFSPRAASNVGSFRQSVESLNDEHEMAGSSNKDFMLDIKQEMYNEVDGVQEIAKPSTPKASSPLQSKATIVISSGNGDDDPLKHAIANRRRSRDDKIGLMVEAPAASHFATPSHKDKDKERPLSRQSGTGDQPVLSSSPSSSSLNKALSPSPSSGGDGGGLEGATSEGPSTDMQLVAAAAASTIATAMAYASPRLPLTHSSGPPLQERRPSSAVTPLSPPSRSTSAKAGSSGSSRRNSRGSDTIQDMSTSSFLASMKMSQAADMECYNLSLDGMNGETREEMAVGEDASVESAASLEDTEVKIRPVRSSAELRTRPNTSEDGRISPRGVLAPAAAVGVALDGASAGLASSGSKASISLKVSGKEVKMPEPSSRVTSEASTSLSKNGIEGKADETKDEDDEVESIAVSKHKIAVVDKADEVSGAVDENGGNLTSREPDRDFPDTEAEVLVVHATGET